MGDCGCGRAVGGVGSDDLGGVDGLVVVGRSTGHEGSDSDSRELHFDDWKGLLTEL